MSTDILFIYIYIYIYNSLERIQAYLDIDHEPKSTEAGKPPAAWPMSGDLEVENLSARYSTVREFYLFTFGLVF